MAKILKISPKKKSSVVLNRINLPLHLSDAVVMKVMDVMDAEMHPSVLSISICHKCTWRSDVWGRSPSLLAAKAGA